MADNSSQSARLTSNLVAELRAAARIRSEQHAKSKAVRGQQCPNFIEEEAADEIERLEKLVHDTGATFTGGNVSCSTCRRIYNRLAASQGWAKFPERPGDETSASPPGNK